MFCPGCNEESLKICGHGSDKIKFTFMKEHSGYREKSRLEASQPVRGCYRSPSEKR